MVTIVQICLLLFGVCEICSNPHVITTQGIMRGKYLQTVNNRTFSAFTAIPYAEPPVGDLRFKVPKPAKPWRGILNAITAHPVCPQDNIYFGDPTVLGDEDCLYLNVYTPQVTFPGTKLRPVMMFIHGGAFLFGSGSQSLYNPKILLDKDIVLVTLNYRLGALGFLSTGDSVVSGNNGLKDQNLAIQWVKKNIISFGGNCDDITLFGQSAGASSAHFHMLSPLSRGLINKVISESGTALAPWALAPNDEGVRNAKILAQIFNCTTTSSQAMVECLRHVNAYDIVSAQDTFYVWLVDPMIPFKPVIEGNVRGAFLKEHPIDIIKSGKAAKIPFITGINTQDGAVKASGIFGNPQVLEEFSTDFERIAPLTFLYGETAPDENTVTAAIKEFYFGNSPINNSSRSAVTEVYTDAFFLASVNLAIRLHIKYTRQPVYHYAFGYRNVISLSMLLGDPNYYYGVSHSDELLYLFPANVYFPTYVPSEADKKISEVLITLWTNIAKFGEPTPSTSPLIHTKWNPVSSNNLEYYFIKNYTDLKMKENLYFERAEFWKTLSIN